MSESGLSVGYPELIGETGKFLGYGYKAYADYEAGRKAELNRFVQSGVRRVYYPPAVDPSVTGYEWSWLRPTTTIDIESGTSDYDLPDDFGRLIGALYYAAEEYKGPISIVSVGRILSSRSYVSLTGIPHSAAIRFKSSDGASGQRQEILFFPEPDDDWTLPATWAPKSLSSNSASRTTTLRTVVPFAGRLSQHNTVKGGRPRRWRWRNAATRNPGAERGAVGVARSCKMSGWLLFNSPVAGSWQ